MFWKRVFLASKEYKKLEYNFIKIFFNFSKKLYIFLLKLSYKFNIWNEKYMINFFIWNEENWYYFKYKDIVYNFSWNINNNLELKNILDKINLIIVNNYEKINSLFLTELR